MRKSEESAKKLMVREPETTIRVVEREEFVRLLEACDDRVFQALLIVAYYQGLRRTELACVRWTAVDFDNGDLHVINVSEAGELTKSRKNRCCSMHSEVREALTWLWETTRKQVQDGAIVAANPHVFTWPDGRPFKPDWVSRRFADLVARSGVASCTLHDLRRSWSTLNLRAGIDKHTVKELGGWPDVSVVERHYAGDVSEAHRRAMKRREEADLAWRATQNLPKGERPGRPPAASA